MNKHQASKKAVGRISQTQDIEEFEAFKMLKTNEHYKKSEHTGEQELCVDDRLWNATNDVNVNV